MSYDSNRIYKYYAQIIIPKEQLRNGEYYAGHCRNASIARWNAEEQVFYHWREKFNSKFIETIEYYDPEGKFDQFVPIKLMFEYQVTAIPFKENV